MCDDKATNTNEREICQLEPRGKGSSWSYYVSWENNQHVLQAQWNVFNKLHICHCRSVLWMPEDITSCYIIKYLSLLENERSRTSITWLFPKAFLWPVGCSTFCAEPILGEVLKAMSGLGLWLLCHSSLHLLGETGLASLYRLMGRGRAARWKVRGFQIFNLQVSIYLARFCQNLYIL